MNLRNKPNKIDWLIYRIFRWWWNPIFNSNPEMAKQFHDIGLWSLKADITGHLASIPTHKWWV